jgi:type IV secretion system protein VirB6
MASTIIGDLVQGFDQQFIGFMAEKSATMIGVLAGPFTKLLIATWIIWWILVAFGQIEDTVFGAFKKFLKIVIFSFLVLNVGNYLKYIAQPLYQIPDQLAGLFIGKAFVGSYQLLDNALTEGASLAKAVQDLGGGINVGATVVWWLTSIFFVWIPTLLTVGFAAVLLMLTKFYLIVVLSIGPFFVMCLFFRATKGMCELWFKQVLTLIFTTWLAFIVIGLMFKLWSAQIEVAMLHPENGVAQMIPLLITSIIAWFALYQAQMFGRGLGGGWHLDVYAAASSIRGVAFSPVDRFARTAGGRIEKAFTRDRSPRNENQAPSKRDETRNWPTDTGPDPVHNHYQSHHHHHHHHNQPPLLGNDKVIDME